MEETLSVYWGLGMDLARMTAHYEAHILHEGTVKTMGGGYTLNGAFHFRWDDATRARNESDGFWRCNSCWAPAQVIHENEEYHRCRDHSPCGLAGTASTLQCPNCGIYQPL
jgi:hypothetical protein